MIFVGLAKMGFEIRIMTFEDAPWIPEFKDAGIEVIGFHPQKKMDKNEIRRIRDVLVENNIDILHLFNSKAIINGIQAARKLPVKVVLYRGYAGNIHWYDPFAYTKFLHPRVDMIVCNSRITEKVFHRQLFFNKGKTITIHKGHDLAWYSDYLPHPIKQMLGVSDDAFLLVNAGNNRKMKGIPYMLKAFNMLPDEANIHLLLIGKNMDDRENTRIMNEGNRRDKIHLLGFKTDVLNYVAASDVFVLPSIKGEALTKSLIEAMSLGIAPVISDIKGNRGLVVNNESGIVFNSKSPEQIFKAIIQLYENRQQCSEFGNNARIRIEAHFNIRQTVSEMSNLYKQLTPSSN